MKALIERFKLCWKILRHARAPMVGVVCHTQNRDDVQMRWYRPGESMAHLVQVLKVGSGMPRIYALTHLMAGQTPEGKCEVRPAQPLTPDHPHWIAMDFRDCSNWTFGKMEFSRYVDGTPLEPYPVTPYVQAERRKSTVVQMPVRRNLH